MENCTTNKIFNQTTLENGNGILKPIPKNIENEFFKSSKGNNSGFAWVSKVGKKWTYSRRINGKPVLIKDENIINLYKKVISQNLIWGVRDPTKAKETLNGKQNNNLTLINGIDELDYDELVDGLFNSFDKFDAKFDEILNNNTINEISNNENEPIILELDYDSLDISDPVIFSININKETKEKIKELAKIESFCGEKISMGRYGAIIIEEAINKIWSTKWCQKFLDDLEWVGEKYGEKL